MSESLSYRGLADLTLIYGETSELGCTVEHPGVDVVVSRHSAGAPVSVLVDRQLGAALFEAQGTRRAALVLPDGTVLAGRVLEGAETGEYIEVAAGSQESRRGRYA